jgi:hypothetical protein
VPALPDVSGETFFPERNFSDSSGFCDIGRTAQKEKHTALKNAVRFF